MLLIYELLASLGSDPSLLHGKTDILVLPDALRSVVKDGVLDNVAAELQVLLTGYCSHL